MSLEKRQKIEQIMEKAIDLNYKGAYEEAILWYEKGFDLALELHNYPNDLSQYKNIEGHYKNDPEFNQKYHDLCRQIEFFAQYAGCLNILNQLDKAKEVAQVAEKFLATTDFLRPYRKDLYSIGSVYFQRKEFEKAAEIYQKVLINYDLDIGNSDGVTIAYAFIRLGFCYLQLNQQDLAQKSFEEGEDVAKLNAVGKNFFLYYYLYKFSDEKKAKKYEKMYLTRLKKEDVTSLNEFFDDNFIPNDDKNRILNDFQTLNN